MASTKKLVIPRYIGTILLILISGASLQSSFSLYGASYCDPDIPSQIQADLSDYKGSGFDRGHLAPAGDNKSSCKAMKETFYLSNISPQVPQFNRGYWRGLERHVRDLTKEYGKVKVITGPLYLPNVEENGKRYVKCQVLGDNDDAVPTHFFKVIFVKKQGQEVNWAYILPNEPIDKTIPLDSFLTTVAKVEKAAGIVFMNPEKN